MAFMHGAQDGQKFMGVFLLGLFLAQGNIGVTTFHIPVWLMILCSLIMALGTSIGGYRIIKAVGMDMVKLEKYQGFSADLAGAGCLLISSLTGLPVSTTPHQNHRHHGRGRRQTPQHGQLGRGKGYGLDLGAHLPRLRYHRILDGTVVYADFLRRIHHA